MTADAVPDVAVDSPGGVRTSWLVIIVVGLITEGVLCLWRQAGF
jgi:hypothetical protein